MKKTSKNLTNRDGVGIEGKNREPGTGSNIEKCREDYDHCMHSVHAIRAPEEIRDILVRRVFRRNALRRKRIEIRGRIRNDAVKD